MTVQALLYLYAVFKIVFSKRSVAALCENRTVSPEDRDRKILILACVIVYASCCKYAVCMGLLTPAI